ncbi:MAG TPA: hypothetical protein VH539_20455 [Gemmatimonadaceae bacterium]|jgi:integrase
MTPDTLMIDRIFKGVGRIKRRSGTTAPAMLRKINRALTELYEEGRLDVLRALRDGKLTPMQVYDANRRRALGELPVGDALPEIKTAMVKWIEDARDDYSPKHVGNLETAQRLFEKHNATARIADLPRVLEELRASYGKKHPRSFNLARDAARAFTRATLKKSHPVYVACAAVEPRSVPKAPLRRLLTVDDMLEYFPNAAENKVDAIAWSMVTTGMGSKELWGRWETQSDRVHIKGTKRDARVRDVPLVRAPTVPQLSRDRFEKNFRTRFDGAITPYDLRRTYMRWMEQAGILRTRRKLYMGHAAGDVSDLYERSEITTFLVEDAKKLRAFLGPKFETSHPLSHPVALAN